MIKHNPYDWEIRPREKTIEELEKRRDKIIKYIANHFFAKKNYVLGQYIRELSEIQEEIDALYIRKGEIDKVYGGFQK